MKHDRLVAESVIYRGLLDSILARAKSKYYHLGVSYLNKPDSLAPKIRDWKEWNELIGLRGLEQIREGCPKTSDVIRIDSVSTRQNLWSGNMARILILQEEPSWDSSLKRSLLGYHELTVVHSSSVAMRALREQRFDAIITRVHLKDEDVFGFLKELKADPTLASLPVICFCGIRSRAANIANSALDEASRLLGASAFVSLEDFCIGEECDFEALRNRIEEAMREGIGCREAD